jgi:hypothetical protein
LQSSMVVEGLEGTMRTAWKPPTALSIVIMPYEHWLSSWAWPPRPSARGGVAHASTTTCAAYQHEFFSRPTPAA